MNKFLFLLVSAFFFFNPILNAQSGNIHGIVIDKATGEKIPFANISLYKNNQYSSNGTATKSDGSFTISNLEYAEYYIVVSFIGFETDTVKGLIVTKEKPGIRLGNIALAVSGIALNEVEVNARISTQNTSLDRKTYRASDFATARGGDCS
jgi:iron complex outermembrane recepter protein